MVQFYLFWAAFVCYVLAWAASLAGVIFKKEFLYRLCMLLGFTGLIMHFASLTVRSLAIGHLPLFGTYENAQAAAWFIVLFSMVILLFYPGIRFVTSGVLIWAVLLDLWGLRFNKNMIPLTISEQSLWVDFHVLFAWMAFGSFFLVWAMAFFQLFGRKGNFNVGYDFSETRELQFKFLTFGYVTYSVMITLGAVYSYLLFGQWWQWDIVETLSLIVWLIYGLMIHLKLFYPHRKTAANILALLAPAGILISYLGLSYLGVQTFHNFDLPF